MTAHDIVDRLHSAASPDEATSAALHRRLEDDAQRGDLLDVAYRTLDTEVGSLLLAATSRGLVRIAFEAQGHEAALQGLAEQVSPRVLRAPRRLDPVARELDEYLTGKRRDFDLPLDFALSHGFRKTVQQRLTSIAYGTTRSYAQLASDVGHPRAARAVGTACATNPLPLVVPCHRVLRADGSVGQYAGGSDVKRALLHLERPAE